MDLSRNTTYTLNQRYIINFSDTSGGYGRDANTIDMTRGTAGFHIIVVQARGTCR